MTLLHQAAQKAVEALKPCPFCEGAAAFVPRAVNLVLQKDPSDPKFGVSVICGKCGAESPNMVDEAHAAGAWNRRPESALQQQPEPVAWRFRFLVEDGRWSLWQLLDYKPGAANSLNYQKEPLYTAPPALQHQEEPREPVAGSVGLSWDEIAMLERAPVARQVQPDHEAAKRGFEHEVACDAAAPSTTRQQEVGSGWKLVPVEPTADMVAEGQHCVAEGFDWPKAVYRAMVKAAPSTPEKPDASS